MRTSVRCAMVMPHRLYMRALTVADAEAEAPTHKHEVYKQESIH